MTPEQHERRKAAKRRWYHKYCDREVARQRRAYQNKSDEYKNRMNKLYRADPDKIKARTKAWRDRLKVKVISLYGGMCACCGEDRLVFLAIDHKNGGGNKHREQFNSHTAYWRWMLEENRKGLRVLCHNCNFAYWATGSCPHAK